MPRHPLRTLVERMGTRRGDVAGVASLVALALAFVSPALKDGGSFGGFDYDTGLTPLGSGVYSVVHSVTNGDAVSQMIAWNDLSWHLVRSGHFPLWNQFSALGMPQFLNFESSVLSLPDLVSYLVPVRFAFLVVVIVKLVIAGTGAYFCARILRCSPLPAAFAGATFMLAGAFSSWLTWPLTDVLAWSGWILGFGLLALRTSGRLRHVVGLGIVSAFSLYGGFPEASVLLAIALSVVIVVAGVLQLAAHRPLVLAGAGRVASGVVLGGLLSAPLWLPGLQVIGVSHRESEGDYVGLPLRALPLLVSQGYYGLPTGPSPQFQLTQWRYYEAVTYVGAIALVLVIVAIGTSLRRPLVGGLFVALLLGLALSYQPVAFHPLQHLVFSIPGLSRIRFERMRAVSSFLIALLAAIGLEELLRAPRSPAVRRSFGLGALGVLAWVAYLDVDSALQPALRHQRFGTLVWPSLFAVVLVAIAIYLLRPAAVRGRLTRGIAPFLVASQAAFLFFAGVGIASYSHPFFQVTPAIARLQSIVGDQLVGLDGGNSSNVRTHPADGFYPNVNIGYSVRLFAVHDPLVPAAYFTSWPDQAAAPNTNGPGLFVPDIDSLALARRYGISYVLTKKGLVPPAGTVAVAVIAGETLSRVPGAAQFSFQGSSDRVTAVSSNGDGAWWIETSGATDGLLVLRVTAEPGFRATIDGKALALARDDGVMWSAKVPPGRHVLTLTYLPPRLQLGVLLGLLGVLSVLVAAVVARLRRSARGRLRAEGLDGFVDGGEEVGLADPLQ